MSVKLSLGFLWHSFLGDDFVVAKFLEEGLGLCFLMLVENSAACFEVVSLVNDANGLGLDAYFPCKLSELARLRLLIDIVFVLIVVLSLLNCELYRISVPRPILIL